MASSIKDVATRAGISIATVSRAVNTPERVSAETLARVQAAMDALQHRPKKDRQSKCSPQDLGCQRREIGFLDRCRHDANFKEFAPCRRT